MPMAGGAAERFPLDEEPAGMDDRSPSPRVVSSSHGMPGPMPPAPMPVAPVPPAPSPPVSPVVAVAPAPMPAAPAPMPAAPAPSAAPTPAATPRAMAPKGAQTALSAVVSQAARSFNPYDVTSPAADGDPRRDAARRAVDAAVDAAAKSGPSFDRERVGAAAVEELVGLGALSALLASPSVREIVVQGPGSVLVDQGQGLGSGDGYFSSAEALSVIVGRLVALSGGQHDGGAARHEGLLPSGFHFTALMPPVAVGGPIVELRRVAGRSLTADQLVARGMLSNDMLEVLRRATRARKAIVVIGAADAGVSACVSGLANLVGEEERVVVVEGSPTLELASSNVVRLTATSGVSLDELITQGGRMRGDRIVIDGVRGPETLGALLTVASRNGSVLGVHSAPGGDTLGYLSALARLGGSNPEALGRILPSAASVLVRVGRGADGRARVESLSEVRHGGGGAQVVDLFGANFAATGQSPSF
jgi:pilus assembly protein CpaF